MITKCWEKEMRHLQCMSVNIFIGGWKWVICSLKKSNMIQNDDDDWGLKKSNMIRMIMLLEIVTDDSHALMKCHQLNEEPV